ncbi:RDD family protein [Nocardioides limicola]|uniref:RDD family protein n=1 Tax=Nocardioides limicola TaxID=2803368 RepID=UPI00193B0ED7|nr:RDD family protein [Nocardioides sp. DJM-14]
MTVAESTYPVAGMERRFLAFVVDRGLAWLLYAGVALALVSVLAPIWAVLLGVGVTAAVVTLFSGVLVGLTGLTPGNALLGLRVVHHGTGTPIGVGRGLLRTLVIGAATLPTFGLAAAALAVTALADHTGQRRAWHDRLASSVVLDLVPVAVPQDPGVEPAPQHVVNLTAMRLRPPPPAPVRRPAQPQAAPEPAAVTAAPVSQPAARGPQFGGAAVAAPPGPGRPRWRITFDTGESLVLEGLALIGRGPQARAGEPAAHLIQLRSEDMSLSKTHAQVQPAQDGALVVMDRGSTNGSVLLRQGIGRSLTAGRPTTALSGDRVRFGDREMLVEQERE